MKKQKNLILNGEWDHLIVLDACRYDVFRDIYDNFLSGRLTKTKSEGSETLAWLKNTFKEEYKLTYFSANPYINSYGMKFRGFKSTDHFQNIEDVWDSKWDEKASTVKPDDMVSYVLDMENEFTQSIIHFIQPHRPFLVGGDTRKWVAKEKVRNENNRSLENFREQVGHSLIKAIGKERVKGLSLFLFGKEESPTGYKEIVEEWGAKRVLDCYEKSLEIVLKSLNKLKKRLEGKIIVTSDHGEAFGENDVWGHQINETIPSLRDVPWFELKK